MRISGFVRISALALTIGLTPILSGCGGNPFNPVIDPGGDGRIPGNTPLADTPQNLMLRFEASYEFQDLPNYENLLTSDFRYTFSQASDPTLVATYGSNWGKDDESESSRHLFDGFTNSNGDVIPKASRIEMSLSGIQYQTDFTHSDSAAYYQKVVVSAVDMTIEVPPGVGATEPTIYTINARHEFYIVRGDAAVVQAGQETSANRWYIRRWDDLSVNLASATRLAALNAGGGQATLRSTQSWGSLKDSFLH